MWKRAINLGALLLPAFVIMACTPASSTPKDNLELIIGLADWLHDGETRDIPIIVTGELFTGRIGNAKSTCVVSQSRVDKDGTWSGFAVYASPSAAKTDPGKYLLRVMQSSAAPSTKVATVEISCRVKCEVQIDALNEVDISPNKAEVKVLPSMEFGSEDVVFKIKKRESPGSAPGTTP